MFKEPKTIMEFAIGFWVYAALSFFSFGLATPFLISFVAKYIKSL
jgi:hypothetical protein